MPKINLHTLNAHDNSMFDLCYESINIVIHNNINDIFQFDKLNYPMINFDTAFYYLNEIKNYLNNNSKNKLILLDFLEGNNTIIDRLLHTGLYNYYINNNQIIIISSGDFESGTYLNIDCFLELSGSNYNQLIAVNNFEKIYSQLEKPYTFLFLNKKNREHRVKLLKNLKTINLLDQSLWSCLWEGKTLPNRYVDCYNTKIKEYNINSTLHDGQWPDGKLFPQLYIDTYFSVVTETNFTISANYRTEKIYKPILMGHPFVAVSSYHFYQGLRNLGFKTFNGLIDETFDNILDNDLRLKSVTDTIKNLCESDLKKFINEAKPICEHNRLHFFELLGKDTITKYNLINDFFKTI
jgi:hypothetical protein